ncbi:hypothetical protein ACIOJE_27325 [Kitasatospora sp. NPDC087861]|uniref:hypothetical protein n=1 Tax=Kitasatospora sp. NPDC087861 TaxID=3364070 RepID=UPI003801F7C4
MRHNGRAVLKASQIPASNITLHPGEPVTVVCTDCRTWRKLTRSMIPAHRSTDLGRDLRDADGKQIKRDTRCPGSGQRIEIDLTLARWVTRIEDGLTETAACRPTTVLRKVKAPAPRAVLHIAQDRPAEPTESARPAARKRAKGWEAVRVGVLVTDALRVQPLYGARSPIFSLPLPDGVATEPPRKHRKRKGRLAA